MLVVAVFAVVIFALALAVLYLTAWPNIVSGARLLTPEGEQLTRAARRRARRAADATTSRARTIAQAPLPVPVAQEQAKETTARDEISHLVARAVRIRVGTARTSVPAQGRSSVSVEAGVSETIPG